jgi:hypothetical protein
MSDSLGRRRGFGGWVGRLVSGDDGKKGCQGEGHGARYGSWDNRWFECLDVDGIDHVGSGNPRGLQSCDLIGRSPCQLGLGLFHFNHVPLAGLL